MYNCLCKSVLCMLVVAFVHLWFPIPACAQLFCIDQLVNPNHAKTWNSYLKPKEYISYYHKNIWQPQHPKDDFIEFTKFQVPMPDSLFASDFFIHRGDYVAVFRNSAFVTIDRISGFWGRSTAANSHIYIGLNEHGLKDAWDSGYTDFYIIDTTLMTLEKFSGISFSECTLSEHDSLFSCAMRYLIQHRKFIGDIWYKADTLIALDSLEQSIRNTFSATVYITDFTDDGIDDVILKTEQKDPRVWPGNAFTFVFESGGVPPQFIRWSEFEQIIRAKDTYLLMLKTWQPHTGMWGWKIYEGKGNGILKITFSESDYST